MSKIRKGSIVWDSYTKRKTKVLTTPGKGELPDKLFLKAGKKYSDQFKQIILLEYPDGIFMTSNSIPCYMGRVENLIPYSEYLEIQEQLQIKNN